MELIFDTREEASAAAAKHIAKRLSARLNGSGRASLVVSGGTTPAQCFAELAEIAIRWENVHVLLSDATGMPETTADVLRSWLAEDAQNNG